MDAAITTLQRALQLDATNFEAAYNLGVSYIQKAQLDQPQPHFPSQSVTINPDLARGHRALGETLIYLNKLDESVTELRRAVEFGSENAEMHHR